MAGKPKTFESVPDDQLAMYIKLPNGIMEDYELDITSPTRTVGEEVVDIYQHFHLHGFPDAANNLVMVLFFADGHNPPYRVLENDSYLRDHRILLNNAEYFKIMHEVDADQLTNEPADPVALGVKTN